MSTVREPWGHLPCLSRCYCCASTSHSHDKGMCPSCKHTSNPLKCHKRHSLSPFPPIPPLTPGCPLIHPSHPLIQPPPPGPSTASLPVPSAAQGRSSPGSHVEFRDTQRRQAPCFSPRAHFQESACVKLCCSRRCPTFKLHSSPWDCFRGFNKRGKSLCMGQQGCVRMCI